MAASIRLLRRRIRTAKNIAQITRAMEMGAASKMRRAQERTLAGKPYAEKLLSLAANLVGRIDEGKHPYLIDREKDVSKTGEQSKTLLLLFSSDKGLAGSYNTNLLREFLRIRKEYNNLEIISIGRKLQKAVIRFGGTLVADFPFGTLLPTFEAILPISKIIVDEFLKATHSKVLCLYTQFISLRTQKPHVLTLLPIQRETEGIEVSAILPYTFEPNARNLLTALMPHYIELTLYQMFLESYASEQASRMIAMHLASENAKDVIWELSLSYNKVRQERITNELLDITTASFGVST